MTNSHSNKTETSFLRHGAKGPAFPHWARAEEQLEKVPPDPQGQRRYCGHLENHETYGSNMIKLNTFHTQCFNPKSYMVLNHPKSFAQQFQNVLDSFGIPLSLMESHCGTTLPLSSLWLPLQPSIRTILQRPKLSDLSAFQHLQKKASQTLGYLKHLETL